MSGQYPNSRTAFRIFKAAAPNVVRLADAARPHWSLRTFAERGFNRVMAAIPPLLGLGDDGLSLESEQAGRAMPLRAESARTGAFVTLDQLERLCQEQPGDYLVEGLLPSDGVHVAVGDSGLGKTPWAYQLGLCVAAGKPFLDREVRQGRVLYFDLENGRDSIFELGRSMCRHLGIEEYPPNFLILQEEGNTPTLSKAIEKLKPALVIIDTLRAFNSETGKNDETARFLRDTRKLARENHCAILLLHHVRKPGDERDVPKLQETPAIEWLNEASGARALINLTNTRIAFDSVGANDDAAFVMKYFVKLKGESGPYYLERVRNNDGEPIGYRTMTGIALLGNREQEAAFERLPRGRFSFKEAKNAYGRSDDPTAKWLKKCIAVGLVRYVDRGVYERIA
jgi:hypothetical protein